MAQRSRYLLIRFEGRSRGVRKVSDIKRALDPNNPRPDRHTPRFNGAPCLMGRWGMIYAATDLHRINFQLATSAFGFPKSDTDGFRKSRDDSGASP
jgi:hypothetical protein